HSTTSFVGRDADLALLARAIERDRLVTVGGFGGIGKTRLVDEFAHRRRHTDTVLRVSLSGLEVPDRFEAPVATELGLFVALDESALLELQRACAAAGGIPLLVELAARSFEHG